CIAGLAAARALRMAGIDDIVLLELEDSAGGNSRGHVMGGLACPLGVHYLPLPGPQATEVAAWLQEIGLLRMQHGRLAADERHLCHAPQERLWVDGAWHEGLLPPADPASATQAQYRAFAHAVATVQHDARFAAPTARAPWTAVHADLDGQTFAAWLQARGLTDERLRWFLDYSCRDDYGAPAAQVSAWAGLHYFASRHGFHAPGDETDDRDAVLTWPEGNHWLVQRLAAPLGPRVQAGRIVRRVEVGRHGVQVLAERAGSGGGIRDLESWQAAAVVMAVPLPVAMRLLPMAPPALAAAAQGLQQAPWLVANLHLRAAPLDGGLGAAPAWDNVRFGSITLGYVDAGHQRLDPRPGPTVLTAYSAWPADQRAALAGDDWRPWAQRVLDELTPLHPDLPGLVQRIDLARYGHAMSIPVPGRRSLAAPGGPLAALADPGAASRLQVAHADLSAYSVFEEAFTHGHRAGQAAAVRVRSG
ncbi:MAG: FAD-dependent oxidoreductase, partial [Aquabacterium sp.]